MKLEMRFTNGSNQSIKVIAMQGKTGYNVRVSHKVGDDKANTGLREQFSTEDLATKAFNRLCELTKSKGWTEVKRSTRNAFTDIPEAVNE